MKPEESSEIILWDWLKVKGKHIKEIYFNRINKINAPIFKVKGESKDKPDFIIGIDRGYGFEYWAVEVKDNSETKNVLDAHKIFRYHKNYRENKTIYYIDEKEIEIKGFLIATKDSINGHLFHIGSEPKVWDNIEDSDDKNWKRCLAKYGFEPRFEFFGSAQFQRHLFAQFREERKQQKLEKCPGIGMLIAEVIDREGNTNNIPKIFAMTYNDYNPATKAKWGCRYWTI